MGGPHLWCKFSPGAVHHNPGINPQSKNLGIRKATHMYQLYHPEKDPLVQRARKRNRHTSPILIAIIVALVGWVAYREVIEPRVEWVTLDGRRARAPG